MMAAKYRPDVTAYALHAQLIGPLEEIDHERQLLLNRPEIRKIYKEAHDVDVAMVGIGAVGPETPGFCSIAEHYGVSPQKLTAGWWANQLPAIRWARTSGAPGRAEGLTKRVVAVAAETWT
jgi:hypothetical protein